MTEADVEIILQGAKEKHKAGGAAQEIHLERDRKWEAARSFTPV
jgi:hypothetical protein